MYLHEALELLGLARIEPPDTVRRAYLRRTKACRPEHDPAGFMRLREAFELVRGFAEVQPDLSTFQAEPPADELETTAETVERRAPGTSSQPPVDKAPTTEPPPDPDVAEITRRLELFKTLNPLTHGPARINLLRDTIRDYPHSVEARKALVDELDRIKRWDAAGDALREAVDDGHHGFFETLMNRYPELLRPDEIDALGGSMDPRQRLVAPVARVLTGDHDHGVEAIGVMLGAGDLDIASSLDRGDVVLCILALIEAGCFDAASTHFEHLTRWRIDHGPRNPHAAVGEFAASELLILGDRLPAAIRVAIAKAARRGELTSATDDLISFAETDPATANRASKLLARTTPLLAQTYDNLLSSEPVSSSSSGSPGDALSVLFRLAPIALVLIGLMNAGRACGNRHHYEIPLAAQTAPTVISSELIDLVCVNRPSRADDPLCAAVAAGRAAIANGDCAAAIASLFEVQRIGFAPPARSPSTIDAVTRESIWKTYEYEYAAACGHHAETSTGDPP